MFQKCSSAIPAIGLGPPNLPLTLLLLIPLTSFGGASKRVTAIVVPPGPATPEGHAPSVSRPAAAAAPAQRLSECVSVLERHQIVEDGVDGGGEVVEESGDVVKVFVDGSDDHGFFEVDVGETLGVEWGPAKEEGQDYSS